jgi:hypothetical protein
MTLQRETLVARMALGLVALHVAGDSFLQPRPGTSASDHLVRGLVPIARLVFAAAAYPRLRSREGRGPQAHARMLARHGYGVLRFDRRGEGESEGDPNLLGWGMDRDLRAAVAFLEERPDVRDGRIGGLGLSVGSGP